MDKNIQIYNIVQGSKRDGDPWTRIMVEDTILRNNEPCHVTVSGETIYTGNEGRPADEKIREGILSRIIRRNAVHRERINALVKNSALISPAQAVEVKE